MSENKMMITMDTDRQRFGVTAPSVFASDTFVLNITGGYYEPIQ